MAIDKSKENSRIADLLAMGNEVATKIAMGIQNPAIYKQFVGNGGVIWDYAVAAGLLEKADAEWIKNNSNIVIKINITYEESDGGKYKVSGTAPKADSDSLEVDKSYTVTVIGSNGEGFTFAGVATETQVGDNETAIVVSDLYTGIGTMNGNWVFSTSADNDNEFGNSVTITITEGGDGGEDNPK